MRRVSGYFRETFYNATNIFNHIRFDKFKLFLSKVGHHNY